MTIKRSTRKKGKSRVSVTLEKEELQDIDQPVDDSMRKKAIEKSSQPRKIKAKCIVISRVDYPVHLEYDNEEIRVSPRAKLTFEDISLLKTPLAKGLLVKKLK